jgi:hypothetical protein
MSVASVSGRERIARQLASPVPTLNSFARRGWVEILNAMDIARYGERREVITSKMSKSDLRLRVAKRMADGEPLGWSRP